MDQDGLWLFCSGEKQEVCRVMQVIIPFNETLFEQGMVHSMTIHHNNVTNADAALMNRDFPGVMCRSFSNGLILDHSVSLYEELHCILHSHSSGIVSCLLSVLPCSTKIKRVLSELRERLVLVIVCEV